MKYESCSLKTTQVIVSEPKCWQSSVVTLTFDLLTPKSIGIFLLSSCIYVWNMKAVPWKLLKLSCQNQSVDKVQLWLWPFDLIMKIYRYLPLSILHLCMKYESCTLKTTQVTVPEPKCWQSSAVTLTFDLLTQKCIGIFLSSSCSYVWNMKAVRWKLLKLSCHDSTYWQSLIVTLTFDLLTQNV